MPPAVEARANDNAENRLRDLAAHRYRRDLDIEGARWNQALDVLLDHRTTRAYLPDPLPVGTLELIVAAAQSAPSSSNMQAWSVIAVEDPARKARLAALAGPNKHIEEAPLLLVWVADLARARAITAAQGQPDDGLDYLESFLLAGLDAAFAAQNAVVAAESLSLGSCYIGAIRSHPLPVAEELALPAGTVALFGLTVGWPDPARASDVKPRLPQTSVLHRERYGETVRPNDLADYNEVLRDFQREQKMQLTDWTELVASRFGKTPSQNGRKQLTEVLPRLGFKLL